MLDGSIFRSESNLEVRFIVTDLQGSEFTIFFKGILPDLFREGQGIVARGTLNEKEIFWLKKFSPSMMKIICRRRSWMLSISHTAIRRNDH